MAIYATQAQLQQFALPAETVAACLAKDPNSVATALQGASDTADGFIKPQFTLPLQNPIPLDLVRAVCKLAAYDLLSGTIGYNPEGDPSALDGFNQAMAWLKNVATGLTSPNFVDSSPGGIVGPAPFVTSRKPRGWW